MKLRNSERSHKFTSQLFKSLGIFSVQGLTIDAESNFTACIEAVEFLPDETIDLDSIFPQHELKAKLFLAEQINVPFYLPVFYQQTFFIYEVVGLDKPKFVFVKHLQKKDFPTWWASLKKMPQTKPIFEATPRIEKSIYDELLFAAGLAWGGNIDGFLFKNKKIAAIIENIYTAKHPLTSPKGEPSYYFFSKGPNYNTWKPTVLLAQKLNVPLLLFTLNGNSNQPEMGFAVIESLSKKGIVYAQKAPNQNILKGWDEIKEIIVGALNSKPPTLIS